uniref:NADH-ubiquinone oxidoreductase chain 4 n=1 Tax=Acanthocardia tuberculata TaxID=385555 RepID=Q06SA1_ACATU|nr:NADH dehydrogenase subunit 4 [Acanthocardia tuberculata]ABF60137.1 NADH dehydrogenase subunit 4 [Acanthocardia tuberculata]
MIFSLPVVCGFLGVMSFGCWPTLIFLFSGSTIMLSFMSSSLEGALLSWWGHLDQMVVMMMLLSIFVGYGALVCTPNVDYLLSMSILVSTISSVLFFMVSGLILFFIFFEAGLIPLAVMILGWGHQPERLQACVSFALYTVVGSLPMFVIVVWVFNLCKTDSMALISMGGELLEGKFSGNSVFWLMLMLCFFVKLPVFGVHGWLPKAHVEAPVAGSMILAGVLLKFGGYGLMRVMTCLMWDNSIMLGEAMMAISLWGAVCSALICTVQSDLKSLIAYSSVSHMGLVMVGVFSCSSFGWSMALLMMVAHGVSSPILFALANYTFELFHSRSLMVCKGLLSLFPFVSMLWFLGCALSMGLPPGSTFLSEIFLISAGLSFSWMLVFPMCLLCFTAGAYSFYLYGTICHGGSGSFSFSSNIPLSGVAASTLLVSEYFLMCSGFMLDLFYIG